MIAYRCEETHSFWKIENIDNFKPRPPNRLHNQLLESFPLSGDLPANTGDMGLNPDLGRFPYATEQLGSCVTTIEPVL